MDRFIAKKRIALDGRVWWCIWDTKERRWSVYIPHFYRFKTRKAANAHIKICSEPPYNLI